MPLTLGLTGMDPDTESALTAAFNAANARLGRPWQLVSEKDADFVIVDMDSMYGPMSWLRLHAARKQVVGLTTASRTQTDFRIERPFDAASVAALLVELAAAAGVPLDAAALDNAGSAANTAPTAPTPAAPAPVAPPSPAPAPVIPPRQAPPPAPVATAPNANVEAPAKPAAVHAPIAAPSAPAGEPTAGESAAPHGDGLASWLAEGRLKGRVKLERGGQRLLIDADARQYVAGTALKPLVPLFDDTLGASDFKPVDGAGWAAEAGGGEPQPLVRLIWLGGLLAGHGRIIGDHDPDGRFHMLKWPQTEREYPKHFRISTVMMKGPATLAEIVAASGVPEADVADFINANLATGFAEQYREPGTEPDQSKSGLFGRLRGR